MLGERAFRHQVAGEEAPHAFGIHDEGTDAASDGLTVGP